MPRLEGCAAKQPVFRCPAVRSSDGRSLKPQLLRQTKWGQHPPGQPCSILSARCGLYDTRIFLCPRTIGTCRQHVNLVGFAFPSTQEKRQSQGQYLVHPMKALNTLTHFEERAEHCARGASREWYTISSKGADACENCRMLIRYISREIPSRKNGIEVCRQDE